jgi:hypothetical protein
LYDYQFKDFAVEIVDISHFEAQNIYGTIESFATTLTLFNRHGSSGLWSTSPLRASWELNNRALQGTHDFVFAIGDQETEPTGPRLASRAGLDLWEGSTSAQTFMKTSSRMI